MITGLKRLTIAAAGLAAIAAAPLAANADPVGQMTPNGAVTAYLPSEFENSPTTTGAQGGTAALTFDGTGKFIREGQPPDLSASAYDVSPVSGPSVRQARFGDPVAERRRVDAIFVSFCEQLRQLNR